MVSSIILCCEKNLSPASNVISCEINMVSEGFFGEFMFFEEFVECYIISSVIIKMFQEFLLGFVSHNIGLQSRIIFWII